MSWEIMGNPHQDGDFLHWNMACEVPPVNSQVLGASLSCPSTLRLIARQVATTSSPSGTDASIPQLLMQ